MCIKDALSSVGSAFCHGVQSLVKGIGYVVSALCHKVAAVAHRIFGKASSQPAETTPPKPVKATPLEESQNLHQKDVGLQVQDVKSTTLGDTSSTKKDTGTQTHKEPLPMKDVFLAVQPRTTAHAQRCNSALQVRFEGLEKLDPLRDVPLSLPYQQFLRFCDLLQTTRKPINIKIIPAHNEEVADRPRTLNKPALLMAPPAEANEVEEQPVVVKARKKVSSKKLGEIMGFYHSKARGDIGSALNQAGVKDEASREAAKAQLKKAKLL